MENFVPINLRNLDEMDKYLVKNDKINISWDTGWPQVQRSVPKVL